MAETQRSRPWAGWLDLVAMQALCSRRLSARPGHAYAHPGDIAWWAGWPPASDIELENRFLLWEDAGVAVGFAGIVDDDGFTVILDPSRLDTDDGASFEEEAETWARARVAGPLHVSELEDETGAAERWRSRGYVATEVGYRNYVRALDPATDLEPPDVAVRAVARADVDARAQVTHAAFGSDRDLASYTAEYLRFFDSPAYPRGWDLLARTPEGQAAACCIAWPDAASRAGTFEPVAVDPSAHRRGYGRVVLEAGFARLAATGHRYAIVGADIENDPANRLYRSVGFEPDHLLRVFVREGGAQVRG